MRRAAASSAIVFLVFAAGCGGAGLRATTVPEGALPVAPGARMYFESIDPRGPREVTVSIVGTTPSFSFELACGHVEPARRLASPSTGVVDPAGLAGGHDVYAIDHCDRPAEHDGATLPAFLVSAHALAALDHHERTTLRIEHHAIAVALLPLGRETLTVAIDGRATPIETLHARGDGMDLWIAETGLPIVVREVDHERGFTLAGIDTAGAATPHARP